MHDQFSFRFATPADVPAVLDLIRQLAAYEHAAERAFAREDKHESGKILYQNVPQRRVVPLAVKPPEQYARIPYASGPDDRAPRCEESPGSIGQDAS